MEEFKRARFGEDLIHYLLFSPVCMRKTICLYRKLRGMSIMWVGGICYGIHRLRDELPEEVGELGEYGDNREVVDRFQMVCWIPSGDV